MPNIIACYKWVLDEQDIKINPANLALDTGRAKNKISDYDRNAIEEAVLQAEKKENVTISGLTYSDKSAKPSLKDALSRGLEKVYWVNDETAKTADGYVTATVLAAALKKIGSYDLVLCGEGTSDRYGQQVGPRMAALLKIPVISFVTEFKLEDDQIIATRKIDNCSEVAIAKLPAIITVLPEINKPHIPSLKQVLGAAKKPVVEWSVADLGLSSPELGAKSQIKSIKGFVMSRKNVIYKEGTAAEKVANTIESLAGEGVL